MVAHIARETSLHIDYCTGFGLTKEEIQSAEEKEGKYLRFISLSISGVKKQGRSNSNANICLRSLYRLHKVMLESR